MQTVNLWLEFAEILAKVLTAAALSAPSSVLVADNLVDDRCNQDKYEEEGHEDTHNSVEYDYLPAVLDAFLHDCFSLKVT